MDRMMSKILAALAVVGVAGTAAGCQQNDPAAEAQPVQAGVSSARVVDPGAFQNELAAAAAICPGLLTPARISTTIDVFSGWRLGQTNMLGDRGLAQFSEDDFVKYTPAGSDPDDPKAAIVAVAGHMCQIGREMSGPFHRGEIRVQDWTATGADADHNAELVGLAMAGVLAGPRFVLEHGGASVRDPNLSAAMIRVMYA